MVSNNASNNHSQQSTSLLSRLMAEEEDNNGKSDFDFISLMNTQDSPSKSGHAHDKSLVNGDSNNSKDTNSNKPDNQNGMYVNKSFSFGGNQSQSYENPSANGNNLNKPFVSPSINGHSRKSSLNYTPSKNYIQPPPVSSSSNNGSTSSPTHTFRKTHKYKHSSVSINYNEVLNITNKINSEDPSSSTISADQEKSHILVNKYLEFPKATTLLKSLSTPAYTKISLSLLASLLIYFTQSQNMYSTTIITLLQSHTIMFLIAELTECIKNDNFYSVHNFDNPFGFQRLPILIKYSGSLYVCYKVINLFFEFLEMIIVGHDSGMHGSHSHSGHQHNDSNADNAAAKVKYTLGFGVMVLSGLLSGYVRDWYAVLAIIAGLILPLDGLILKVFLVALLSTYLVSKCMMIINYLLLYLNMSTKCGPKKIEIIKEKLNLILMTEKYDLKVGDITDECSIVLIKVDKQVNIIDLDLKQKIYNLMQSELKTKNIMLTVQY